MPTRAPSTRGTWLRSLARRWHLGLLAVAAVAAAAPVGMLAHGTSLARACVASYEAPRGLELPECRGLIPWMVFPSRVPWTASPARYRAEEITVRAAVAAYHDAAVGRPDAAALGAGVERILAVEKVIAAGSQRLALEDLGRAVGTPDAGRSAMLLGDRRTLLARADQWPHWSVRLRSLEAALLEGDLPRAQAIAKRYAEFDPRDEDLRVAVASVLCLGDDAKRGLSLLDTVQTDRGKDRHENWIHNFGEVRALIVGCAARAGLPPPKMPDRADHGVADLAEARAVLRLRLATPQSKAQAAGHDPVRAAARRDALENVAQMLKGGPLGKGVRVHLLAAWINAGDPIEAAELALLAAPRAEDGEPALRPGPLDLTAVEWLAPGRGLRPAAGAWALRQAAEKLRHAAASPGLAEPARLALGAAAAASSFEAARTFARAGRPADALAALDEGGADLGPDAQIARSSVYYVAGEARLALTELQGGTRMMFPNAGDAHDVTWWLQHAELEASLGNRGAAGSDAAKADEMAQKLGDRRLDVRAQWARLAFAGTRRGEGPLRVDPRAFPWVGVMDAPGAWLDPAAEGPAPLAQALDFWAAARAASGEERRALRYAILRRHAGDTARARAPYLLLAGELLPAGDGDVEIWLDAFSATAARGTTMRAHAWARAEAARMRGDAPAAAAWSKRYRVLVDLAGPDENAEIAAALGL